MRYLILILTLAACAGIDESHPEYLRGHRECLRDAVYPAPSGDADEQDHYMAGWEDAGCD